jgi:hypothetical protein
MSAVALWKAILSAEGRVDDKHAKALKELTGCNLAGLYVQHGMLMTRQSLLGAQEMQERLNRVRES